MSKIARACSALVATSALVLGCGGRPYVPQTPPGFVEFKEKYDGDEYRAATADGVVLGIRAFKNEPKGELGFWVQAIKNRLRDVGGYALLETRPVADRANLKGTELRFGHDGGSEPHLYIVAIFASEERVKQTRAVIAVDQIVMFLIPGDTIEVRPGFQHPTRFNV